MKAWTVIQQGVYRHTIEGVFSSFVLAVAAADEAAATDRDDWHTYDVHVWTVDELPAPELEVYSVNRSAALAKRRGDT